MPRHAGGGSDRRFLGPLLAVVAGVLLLLAGLEIGLRTLGWWHLRGQEPPTTEAALRILCVGESTTEFGGDQSYPAQLERILAQRLPGTSVQVVNRGESARDTSSILAHLPRNLDAVRPRIVVAMMGANDVAGGAIPTGTPSIGQDRFPYGLRVVRLLRQARHDLAHPERRVPIAPQDTIALMKALESGDDDAARARFERLWTQSLEEDLLPYLALLSMDPARLAGWARQLAEARLAGHPRDPAAQHWRAVACMAQGDEACAEASLEALLDEGRDDPRTFLTRDAPGSLYATLLAQQGRMEELDDFIASVGAIRPDDPRPLRVQAGALLDAGRIEPAEALMDRADALELKTGNPVTRTNYLALQRALEARGIGLVAVQYPTRPIEALHRLVQPSERMVFVDNQPGFARALREHAYEEIFTDRCYTDFGHGTAAGNRLLAENVAEGVLELLPRLGAPPTAEGSP